MQKVICNRDGCRYWTEEGCSAEEVSLLWDGWYEGECRTYENYANAPEYHEPFWLRRHDEAGNEIKIRLCGRRVEYKGRIFYTRDKMTEDELFGVIDGETGIAIGLYRDLEERFQDLLSYEKVVKKLEDVPERKSPWQDQFQETDFGPFEPV